MPSDTSAKLYQEDTITILLGENHSVSKHTTYWVHSFKLTMSSNGTMFTGNLN